MPQIDRDRVEQWDAWLRDGDPSLAAQIREALRVADGPVEAARILRVSVRDVVRWREMVR